MFARVRLSLPRDASIDEGRISVLTPVGAALIGTLTLTWLVVQIVKSVLNPVRGHIAGAGLRG